MPVSRGWRIDGTAFGARTGRAPFAMGFTLLVVALSVGSGLAVVLTAFPLPILAGLLATAGLLHIGLLGDLRGAREWSIAIAVGAIGFGLNLAVALAVGLFQVPSPTDTPGVDSEVVPAHHERARPFESSADGRSTARRRPPTGCVARLREGETLPPDGPRASPRRTRGDPRVVETRHPRRWR
jgi:hypothetical protein